MSSVENRRPPAALEHLREISSSLLRYAPTKEILDLWLEGFEAAPENGVPGFDPLDAPTLLGFLYILERDGGRMRYRVSGESVNILFGSNHAGKYLDEVVPPDVYPLIEPFFLDVFNLKACIFKGHVLLSKKRLTEFERLLLPVHRGDSIQILGTLALSTSAPLRSDAQLPPSADPGFQFTQVDLMTGDVTETAIPLDELAVEQMPFEDHLKRRKWAAKATRGVVQTGSETVY